MKYTINYQYAVDYDNDHRDAVYRGYSQEFNSFEELKKFCIKILGEEKAFKLNRDYSKQFGDECCYYIIDEIYPSYENLYNDTFEKDIEEEVNKYANELLMSLEKQKLEKQAKIQELQQKQKYETYLKLKEEFESKKES
jgi:hypothetical protein